MEALTALVARLLAWLHGLNPDAVCPGGWPWAVSLLGVGVGLLPAAGAGAVALWRRRRGSRYGPGGTTLLVLTGLLAAGGRRSRCSGRRGGCSPRPLRTTRSPG